MAVPKYMARDAELLTAGADAEGRAIPQWQVTQRLLAHVGAAFAGRQAQPWSAGSGTQSCYGGAWSADTYGTSGGYAKCPTPPAYGDDPSETRSIWTGAGNWGSGGWAGGPSAFSTDCCRNWAPNGQCFYADMAHWEGCSAEHPDPLGYAAQSLSLLRVAEAARVQAQCEAEPGTQYTLSAHNVDGEDPAISWGTHDNVYITNELWEDLFAEQRHPATLGFVASAMAAAVAWFGSGYLLPLSDGSTAFSLSGRAHHLGRLISQATTIAFERGLLNSRREPHSAAGARMHLIGFDFSLASAALKSCFVQCFLAAAEEGFCDLIVFDPLRAVRNWSWGVQPHNAQFTARATLIDGRQFTLPAYVRELATTLLRMVEGRLITPEVAPRAAELLPRIIESTHYAEEGALAKVARHSDWAATLLMILGMCQRPGVRWGDSTTVLANQDYANTDPARGHFWQLWEQGLVDPLVTEADVEACLDDGPVESRGWGRGRLVRKFGRSITNIDWSYVELRRDEAWDRWSPRLRLEMPRLDALNRAEFGDIVQQARTVNELEALLNASSHATVPSDPVIEIAQELALDHGPSTDPRRRPTAGGPAAPPPRLASPPPAKPRSARAPQDKGRG